MAQAQTLSSFGWPGRDWRLALADTVAVVRDQTVDLLSEESQVAEWLTKEQERLGPVLPGEAPSLSHLHELRDAIRSLLYAAVAGEPLPTEAAATVNRFSAAGAWYRQLDVSEPERPRVSYGGVSSDRASQVLAAIADSAIELLTGPDRERIRVCSAPSCGMFYIAGKSRQQWCSTSCGNRARVARHYERSRHSETA